MLNIIIIYEKKAVLMQFYVKGQKKLPFSIQKSIILLTEICHQYILYIPVINSMAD